MGLDGKKIVIVGGGIGGLAASLALAHRGAEVRVLEQADAIREVGAGLQISPNGARVLEALGLGEALADIGLRAEAVSLRDYARGAEVLRLDLKRLGEAQRYYFVHRADLIARLADAARGAGVDIRLSQGVRAVEPGAPPRLELADGSDRTGDLIVGADGLHSVLRGALNGVSAPFFTGQVAWRAVVANLIGHPPHARVHMGPGRHLVSYPLRGGQEVNVVAVEERRDWVAESWSQEDAPENLRAAFAGFGAEVHQLLGAVERPGLWGLFRHPVARVWHGPGVAILGDAAHPTLPFLAQGANMALEDAWVLADALAAAGDMGSGLARYQARRRDRVVRVIEAANGNAWKYHLRNPLVRRVAHLGMGVIGRVAPGRLLHGFDWLYAHDVTRQG